MTEGYSDATVHAVMTTGIFEKFAVGEEDG